MVTTVWKIDFADKNSELYSLKMYGETEPTREQAASKIDAWHIEKFGDVMIDGERNSPTKFQGIIAHRGYTIRDIRIDTEE